MILLRILGMSVSFSVKKSRGFFGGVFQEDITQLFCYAGLCDRMMGNASMSVSSSFVPALTKPRGMVR